jgi:hypothetical protein
MSTPRYPGRIVQVGEVERAVVVALQERLVARGCGPLGVTGVFEAKTRTAVRLFQGRFPDRTGAPLVVDGKVGPLTWAALFGDASVPGSATTDDSLLARVVKIATGEVGVLEVPPGSNRGPRVNEYLRAVGLEATAGSFPWCAAFVYWCFDQAAREFGRPNPVVRTAGVLNHWRQAEQKGIPRLPAAAATADPARVRPGMVFVQDFGGGAGHTGLVESVQGGWLVTLEGNTNDGGSREGIGVFRRSGRKVLSINRGFIDYAGR